METNFESEFVKSSIRRWQELDLMPVYPDKGVLVWRCLNHKFEDEWQRSFQIGKEFNLQLAVCAGPFGAVRLFRNRYGTGYDIEIRLVAIYAKALLPIHTDSAIFNVLKGTPVASYGTIQITPDGFKPLFFEGEEDDNIRGIFCENQQ